MGILEAMAQAASVARQRATRAEKEAVEAEARLAGAKARAAAKADARTAMNRCEACGGPLGFKPEKDADCRCGTKREECADCGRDMFCGLDGLCIDCRAKAEGQ